MLFSNFVKVNSSTTDTSITLNPTASGSVVIIHTDVPAEEDWKRPPTPWKRSHAAYTPRCRVTPAFLRGRKLLAQQRPRDGLHAIN